jgi:hypothetical protein
VVAAHWGRRALRLWVRLPLSRMIFAVPSPRHPVSQAWTSQRLAPGRLARAGHGCWSGCLISLWPRVRCAIRGRCGSWRPSRQARCSGSSSGLCSARPTRPRWLRLVAAKQPSPGRPPDLAWWVADQSPLPLARGCHTAMVWSCAWGSPSPLPVGGEGWRSGVIPAPPARPSAARGQRPKHEARQAQRDAHAAPAGRALARLGVVLVADAAQGVHSRRGCGTIAFVGQAAIQQACQRRVADNTRATLLSHDVSGLFWAREV